MKTLLVVSAEAHGARRERAAHQERAVACGGGGGLVIKGGLRGGPASQGRADFSDHRVQARACGHIAHIGCRSGLARRPWCQREHSRVLGTRPKPFSPAAGLVRRPSRLWRQARSLPSAVIGEGSLGQAGLGLMCAPVRACVPASELACACACMGAGCTSACRVPIAMSGSFFSRAIVSAFRCAAWWLQHRRTMPHAGMSRGSYVAPRFSRAPGCVAWVAARLVACCAVRASIST